MLRYIIDPEDELRLDGGVIGIFSGARMMTFDVRDVRAADTVRQMPVDKTRQDALRFVAVDALLGREYEVFVPERHRDFAAFSAALTAARPELNAAQEGVFTPPACDGNGHHFD